MVPHGHVVWSELNTRDPEAAKRFFATTIGWTADSMPMPQGGTYWVFKAGDAPVAGAFMMEDPAFAGVPEHWLTYVEVDDIDARTTAFKAAGATMLREPFDVTGVGRVAIVKLPGGGVMGFMSSVQH